VANKDIYYEMEQQEKLRYEREMAEYEHEQEVLIFNMELDIVNTHAKSN
jgi:hypothetical protein